jgi:hypothetical protein
VKRGRKEGRRKRMLGNKIFRMKRRKANSVRNKYENNMEISLDPPVAFYLFKVSPLHFLLFISPPSTPSPSFPPSLSHKTHHSFFYYIN